MTRSWLRIEHLLAAVPLLAVAWQTYQVLMRIPGQEMFIGPPQTITNYVLVSQLAQFMHWVILLLPGYLMHYFLRAIGRWRPVACTIHAIITAFIVAGLSLGSEAATSVAPGWHTTIYPPAFPGFGGFIRWINIAFWLTQAIFIVYGLVIIQQWKKVNGCENRT